MSKPFIHAKNSATRFGGKASDYVRIHEKMDCSKGEIGDLRHRALTHHMFFVRECIVPLFGSTITNSAGEEVSVVEICEQHMAEDFSDDGKQQGFIPTAGDYLAEMNFETWLNNGQDGAHPASQNKRVVWSNRLGPQGKMGPSGDAGASLPSLKKKAIKIIRDFDDGVMDTAIESNRAHNLPPVHHGPVKFD